jgi:thiol-disulfide isomerase/thioredoxin
VFNRTHLLIVLIALFGAGLGLLAGSWLDRPMEPVLPEGMAVLKPGDLRADLALTGVDGAPHRLSEWDGKLVLVNFWAKWCEPCRDEMPLLDHARAQHTKDGFEVIGVAIDDHATVRDYLRESPVAYPILLGGEIEPDPSVTFGDTRKVLPYSVLVGRDGRIIAQHAGSFSSSHLSKWLGPSLNR